MKRPILAALFATMACAGVIAPGFAKPKEVKELRDYVPTGSHIRIKPTILGDKKRNLAITAFSRCLVLQAGPKVDHYLRNSDAFASKDNAKELLPLSECLGEAMSDADESMARFSWQGLRGWLAEQAYLKANKKFVAPDADTPPPPPRQYFTSGAGLRMAKRIGEFSDCIVSRDAAGADAILRAQRGSAAEFEASKVFAPALSACLVGNSEVSFSSETLRAYVADGLWQRYEAGKPLTIRGGS